ncbi:site-specific integrase [Yersinia ruckeri]|uniref:tyrosine-type recombinase/integrase n=1 Tax=Yersinia ruckeri TaxID=29486 RepID=UPI002237F09A|nr:site-specific integrase [Yersinia ruckeri]MCW6556102.1 site-specific integrase [Yersinia ruckeri]UZX74428.1 site-specific integrase [Yersinia ruckeri]
MAGDYLVRKIKAETGERFCMILDRETGLPHYYYNIYLTLLSRIKGKSFNTILRNAYVLILFEEYLIKLNINLKERMEKKTLLTYTELYTLTENLKLKRKEKKVLEINGYRKFNADNLHYRLAVISNYISWYYESYYSGALNETKLIIEMFKSNVQKHKPKIQSKLYVSDNFKSLEVENVAELFKCLEPSNNNNPYDEGSRVRNQLILHVLHETGMRGGELLNLRLTDFSSEKKFLRITRRVNTPEDPRIMQPLVKTLERDLNISTKLTNSINEYIEKDRSFYTKNRKHEYLFVTHKCGPSQGLPLTISAYNKIIRKIRGVKTLGAAFRTFTGHTMRHTWNHIYNLKYIGVTDINKISQLNIIRCLRMGWAIKSNSELIYNNRYIYEQTLKAFEDMDLTSKLITKDLGGGIDENIDSRKLLGIKNKRQRKRI